MRKFRWHLSTAFVAMLLASAAAGVIIHLSHTRSLRRDHAALVEFLLARRPNGFGDWDFSSEHAFSEYNGVAVTNVWTFLQKPGAPQHVIDQLVEHADDKDLSVFYANFQIYILMIEMHYVQPPENGASMQIHNTDAFIRAWKDGRFERAAAAWADVYIRDKLDCIHDLAQPHPRNWRPKKNTVTP